MVEAPPVPHALGTPVHISGVLGTGAQICLRALETLLWGSTSQPAKRSSNAVFLHHPKGLHAISVPCRGSPDL